VTTDTSKPAFPANPYNELGERNPYAGLSAREYFAARAPAEIPQWFKGPECDVPNSPADEFADFVNLHGGAYSPMGLALKAWENSGGKIDPPEEFRDIAARIVAYNEAHREYDIKRYFAWRWYYADMMVASGQWSPTKLEGG